MAADVVMATGSYAHQTMKERELEGGLGASMCQRKLQAPTSAGRLYGGAHLRLECPRGSSQVSERTSNDLL